MRKRFLYGIALLATLFLLFPTAAQAAGSGAVSAYQKLNSGLPVRIAVLGDSIADKTGVEPNQSWNTLLFDWLHNEYPSRITMDSYAVGGTSSYTGYYQSETAMRQKIRKNGQYDLVIICYGQNDETANFGLYYEGMLRSVKRQNPSCQFITILESTQQIYTEKMLEILRLSEVYHADVADTISAFALSGIPFEQLTPDGTHPNAEGHWLYFETLRSVIENGVAQGKPVTGMPSATTPYVTLFENYSYIPLEKCKVDEGLYCLRPKTPTVGILFQKFPGGSDILLEFSTGELWADSGDTIIQKEWTVAAPVGLLVAPGTDITLQDDTGVIAETVAGFICSGHLP